MGWTPELREYIDSLKQPEKWGGKPYSARRAPARRRWPQARLKQLQTPPALGCALPGGAWLLQGLECACRV